MPLLTRSPSRSACWRRRESSSPRAGTPTPRPCTVSWRRWRRTPVRCPPSPWPCASWRTVPRCSSSTRRTSARSVGSFGALRPQPPEVLVCSVRLMSVLSASPSCSVGFSFLESLCLFCRPCVCSVGLSVLKSLCLFSRPQLF